MSKKTQVRKELVNELRKAHFYMGFEKEKTKDSIYRRDYQEYPIEGKDAKDPNLRASHYTLGDDKFPHAYDSINKTDYLPPLKMENAKLDEAKKKDLRSHHFALGYDNDKIKSEAREQFTVKPIDPSIFDDKTAMCNFLRKHNHDFGDKNTYFNSMYDNNYNSISKIPKEAFHQGKSKEQIMKEIVELRKTNLVIGNDPVVYESSNQNDFRPLETYKTKPYDPKLKETNYILGTDPVDFKTNYQNNYFNKPIEKNELKKELIKDLRATHFSVGNDKLDFMSENANKYKEPNREAYNTVGKDPSLQKNHYCFGDDTLKDPKFYTSVYKNIFQNPPQTSKVEQARNQNNDRGSNIKFGEYNDDIYKTEHRSQFYQKPWIKSELNEKLKNDLKMHHNVLGIDPNDWVSENHYIFGDKSKTGVINVMDAALKADLRRNHFEYGFQNNQFKTSGEEIGSKQCRPNKLNPELEKDLRQHHFAENDGNGDWHTIYRDQFIWKNPIDD